MKFLYTTAVAIVAALTINTGYAQQICNSNVEETTPTSRFDISEGEALDTKTGLIWRRCLLGQYWNEETRACDGQTSVVNWKLAMEAATDGWRVPNVKELGSVVEHSCANPSINLSVFPDMPIASGFWTSTPSRRYLSQPNDERVWLVRFQDGTATGGSKDFQLYTLFVKDSEVTPVIEIAN